MKMKKYSLYKRNNKIYNKLYNEKHNKFIVGI